MEEIKEIRIQDDLYQHVNGEWLRNAVIPDDRPTIGGFAILDKEVEETLMKDFSDYASGKREPEISSIQDAVELYRKVLDTKRRNELSVSPIMPLLHRISEIRSIDELNKNAKELYLQGVPLPFNFGVDTDMKDATKNSFVLLGADIILPDTVYYGKDDGEKLLTVYRDMVEKLLSYTNLSDEEKKQYLKDTFLFDELISKKVKSQLEWADYVKNYNPLSVEETCGYLQPFDLEGLLKNFYDEPLKEVILYDPKAIREFHDYFNEETFSLYLHWAYVKTLVKACRYLSEELYRVSMVYQRSLTGTKEDPKLEKQAYQAASSFFSEPVGIYYGRTYFGEEAKKDIISIVHRIIDGYKKRIRNSTFLEDATKEKAIEKLSAISIKMGYPDNVRDIYQKMKVDPEDSYYDAVTKIRRILLEDELSHLHKPVDKSEWLMPGYMVNACYDPSRNDITFPAAILQKPFYALDQTISENLGGIGAVIAHEISHAFDNNGAHFDENGNLNNWWTDKDLETFNILTKKMIEQWDGIEYHGIRLNGEMIVSENIADNGGIAVTIDIMHETPNTDFKLYFRNWAKVWCLKAKEEYIQLRAKNDVHSPAELRANIQVRNFREWYEAFDVKETDQMYLPPKKRIIIW